MKKLFILLATIAMICASTGSFAEELTLPVKMERQIQNDGNGLKGSFIISSDSDAEDYPFIAAFQNAEINVLRNMSGNDWHLKLFQKDEADQPINTLELYSEKSGIFLSGSLAGGAVYSLPAAADLLDSGIKGTHENPSVSSAVVSLVSMSEQERTRWDPVLEKYEKGLLEWVNSYFAEPAVRKDETGAVQSMILSCTIPADDVKQRILEMIETASADTDILSLMNNHASDEQKTYYLNSNLLHYYSDVLQNIRFAGDIQFAKAVSAMGETFSTEMRLPLDETSTGYSWLLVRNENGVTIWQLTGKENAWLLAVPDNLSDLSAQKDYDCDMYLAHADFRENPEQENMAVHIHINRTQENYMDENTGKEHEIHRYVINAARDDSILPEGTSADMIPAFDPIEADCSFHYSGKTGPNSQTTLEVNGSYTRGKMAFSVEGKLKTAATWPFVPFDISSAVSFNEMDAEAQGTAVASLILNASRQLVRIQEPDESAEGGKAE